MDAQASAPPSGAPAKAPRGPSLHYTTNDPTIIDIRTRSAPSERLTHVTRTLAAAATLLMLFACFDRPLDARADGVFAELRSFAASEAHQGVAVDAEHFYAISNRRIGKYDKEEGRRIAGWEDETGGPFIHLNSGVVIDGLLYAAHSNYPAVPMVSSIEIFDPSSLTHVDSRRLEAAPGSATWVDRHDGRWWVAFANYAGRGGVPGRGPEWTTVVEFDDGWRRLADYRFPAEIVDRFDGMSTSGGAFGDDGLLYVTGHDAPEIYVLRLPAAGSVLEHVRTLAVPAEGQGIAFDPSHEGVLYSIVRSSNQVVVSRLEAASTSTGS